MELPVTKRQGRRIRNRSRKVEKKLLIKPTCKREEGKIHTASQGGKQENSHIS